MRAHNLTCHPLTQPHAPRAGRRVTATPPPLPMPRSDVPLPRLHPPENRSRPERPVRLRSWNPRSWHPRHVVAVSAGLVCALAGVGYGATVVDRRAEAAREPAPVWTRSWTASQQRLRAEVPPGHTVRLLVHPTLEGSAVRIHLSNLFGHRPLVIDSAAVAVSTATGTPDLVAGSVRPLRFDGSDQVVVMPGSGRASDPADLSLAFGQDLVVDLHVREAPKTLTGHRSSTQTSFAAAGDHAGEESGRAFTTPLTSWHWLDAVEVLPAPGVRGTVVVLGDSLTDGSRSTRGADRRWTDALATRLSPMPAHRRRGVLNQGIVGNRLLTTRRCCGANDPVVTRFARDVLVQPAPRTLVLEIGLNDIRHGARPAVVTDGLEQVARRARALGLRVVGTTLTPAGCDEGCLSPAKEGRRQVVNAWIRSTDAFDAVLDADAIVRDPVRPDRLLPAFDGGDHLHLNDAGYGALAHAVDLDLL